MTPDELRQLASYLRNSDEMESLVRDAVTHELQTELPAGYNGRWELLTSDDFKFLHEMKVDIS